MNDTSLRVGVFFGGPSTEYDVSRMSANAIVKALAEAGHTVIAVGVSTEGKWYAPVQPTDVRKFSPDDNRVKEVVMWQHPTRTLLDATTFKPVAELDVAFPIIHGAYGEDGHLQGFFDMVGLPYAGASMAASVVGMDKVYMRDIVAAYDVPQVRYNFTHRFAWQNDPDAVLERIEGSLPYPIFVKPANAGSSVGVSKAENTEELRRGIDAALKIDNKILFEEGLDVREIEISGIGNENPEFTMPGEIVAGKTFYDYEAKYESESSYTIIPAELSAAQVEELHDYARRVYGALDLCGFSRMDFFIDRKTDRIYFNEVNTLPGFTPISMYAKLWAAQGVEMPALVDRLVRLAMARHEQRVAIQV